jgi:hypothetical protein
MTITETGTITTERPAEYVSYGREVHARATSAQWPASVRQAVASPAGDLLDAIETYDAIRGRDIHPAAEWIDLASEDEAQYIAEQRAAEAVRDLTSGLIRVFPGCALTAESEVAA